MGRNKKCEDSKFDIQRENISDIFEEMNNEDELVKKEKKKSKKKNLNDKLDSNLELNVEINKKGKKKNKEISEKNTNTSLPSPSDFILDKIYINDKAYYRDYHNNIIDENIKLVGFYQNNKTQYEYILFK